MSAPRVALFVVDTGPLITLAAADSLDYLLYPNVPIIIADAVFYEATRDSGKLGAQSIIDWVKAHRAHVEIAITNTYVNFDAARSLNPRPTSPTLGSARPSKWSKTPHVCKVTTRRSCSARKPR